jgi:hypothetical protein
MVYYETGTATSEQGLVGAIDTFLTGTVGGWAKIDTITDSGTDKDLVFYSPGSIPGKFRGPYVRVRGNADYVKLYGYTSWNIDTNTGTDELSNASNCTWVSVGSTTIAYWLFGTRDWFWFVGKNGSSYNAGFGGLIDTYYDPSDDDYPLAIVGQYSNTYSFTANRAYMYVPFSIASGVSVNYTTNDSVYSTLLVNGSPNARDSSIAHQPVLLRCIVDAYDELRGELPGIVHLYGSSVTAEQWVVISGTGNKYFVQKNNTTTLCWGIGPVPV